MKTYSKRRSVNRGYMKLEVWQKAIELYQIVWRVLGEAKLDFKIRSQVADASQSVSANIAEGYSRRSINEYIQHLYIALGSLSETLSRCISLHEAGQFSDDQFEEIDTVHYEVENKLWGLVRSLEQKKRDGSWVDRISEETVGYDIDQENTDS
ncbi:MAG: four helix bundle protein [Bacteroidota bacterium]